MAETLIGFQLPNGPVPEDRIARVSPRAILALASHEWWVDQVEVLGRVLDALPGAIGYLRWEPKGLLGYSALAAAYAIAARARMCHPRCRDIIPGNELNLPQEGTVLSPDETARRLAELANLLRAALPGWRIHCPAFSPGPGNFLDYYRAIAALPAGTFDLIDIHAYGVGDLPVRVVSDVRDLFPPGTPFAVTEWNWGGDWQGDPSTFRPSAEAFLRSVAGVVESVSWFIWRWSNPDSSFRTSPNIEGSALEPVFTDLCKPGAFPAPEPPPQEHPLQPMHKRAYIHQFDQLGEQTYQEIAATLRLADIREVACKTHQLTTWIGRFDTKDQLDFASIPEVRAAYEAFKAEGIRFVPWCVPMGLNVPAEVAFAADVARACDGVVELDTEPYTEFWEGPYNLLLPYTQGLHEAGVRYEVNFDARPSGWHPFTSAQFAQVCAGAEAVWTQSYWTTFQRPAVTVIAETLDTLKQLGIDFGKVGVIFPWDGPDEYVRMAGALEGFGIGRIGMWKMGPAGPAVFSALAQIPTSAVPELPPVTPTPHFDFSTLNPFLDGIWHETEQLAAIDHKDRAERIQRQVGGLKAAVGLG